jgi:RNA polymerase sigma-70 factor, ECF subfamily
MGEGDADESDVARVLAGDVEAFAGIVARWQRRLLGLAWRFCRDRARAEDMAQEAFLKAFRSLRQFRGESSFATWLTAVALNVYRSRLRSDGPPLVGLDATRLLAALPGAPQAILERERAEALRRAVLALPARYRDALVVYYFEERDLADAAAVLGVPEGTLKARLSRGRELLKRRAGILAAGREALPDERS